MLTASSRTATLSGRPSNANIQAASCDVAAMNRIVPEMRAVDTKYLRQFRQRHSSVDQQGQDQHVYHRDSRGLGWREDAARDTHNEDDRGQHWQDCTQTSYNDGPQHER